MAERAGKGRKRKAADEAKAPAEGSGDASPAAPVRGKVLPAHCAKVALVLQGGGALGAYQAGVYEALAEHGYEPYRVTGISIGAINGAIIAGNAPEQRVERLREFWELITE